MDYCFVLEKATLQTKPVLKVCLVSPACVTTCDNVNGKLKTSQWLMQTSQTERDTLDESVSEVKFH